MSIKKRLLRLFAAAQVFIMTSAAPWEGVSSIAPSGLLPDRGYYAATNTYPNDTVIDVTNLETGRAIQVIVKNSANVPGGMILLSREAADAVGMRANVVSRLRANQPGDVAAYPRTNDARPYAQGDPDFDPRAAIQSYALPQDFSYSGPYPYSPYPDTQPYNAPYSNMAAANNPPPYNILPDRIAPEMAAPPTIVSAPPPPVEPVVIVMPSPVAIAAAPEIRFAEAPKEMPREASPVKPESAPQVSAPVYSADSPNVVPSYPPLYDKPYSFAGAAPLAREFIAEPSIPAPALSSRPQTEAPLPPPIETPDYPNVVPDWSPRYETPLALGNPAPGVKEFSPEPPPFRPAAPSSEQLAAPEPPLMIIPADRTPSVPPAANLADAPAPLSDFPDTVQRFTPDPEKLPARAAIPSPEIEHYLTEPLLSQADFIEQKPEATANDYPELYYDNTYAWVPAPEIRTDDNGSSYINVMPPETAWLNSSDSMQDITKVPEPQIMGYGPEAAARPESGPDTTDVFQTPNDDSVIYSLAAPRMNPAAEAPPLMDAPAMAYAPPLEETILPPDFPDTVSVWNAPSEQGTGMPESPAISSYPFESAPPLPGGFNDQPQIIEKTPSPYFQSQGITDSPSIESYPAETIPDSAFLAERPHEDALDFPEVFPHFASPSYNDRPYLENPDVKTYTPDEARRAAEIADNPDVFSFDPRSPSPSDSIALALPEIPQYPYEEAAIPPPAAAGQNESGFDVDTLGAYPSPGERGVGSMDLPPYSFVDSQIDNPETVSGDIPPFESRDFSMTNPGIQSYNPDERNLGLPLNREYEETPLSVPDNAEALAGVYPGADEYSSRLSDIPGISSYPYEQSFAEPALDTPEVSRSVGEPIEKTNPYLWTPGIDQYPVSEALPEPPRSAPSIPAVPFEEKGTEIADVPDAVETRGAPSEYGVGAPFPPEIQQYYANDAAPDNADAARFYDTPERGIGGLWEEPRLTENTADALSPPPQSPAFNAPAGTEYANVNEGYDNPPENGIAELYGPALRPFADSLESFYDEPQTLSSAGDPAYSDYYGLNEPGISEARPDGISGSGTGVPERDFQPGETEEIAEATFSPQNPFGRDTGAAYEPAINGYEAGIDNAEAAGAYNNPYDSAVGDLIPPYVNEYGAESPAAPLASAQEPYTPGTPEAPQVESFVKNPDEGGVGIAPDPAYFYDNPDALSGVKNPGEAEIPGLPPPAIALAPPAHEAPRETGGEDNLDALAGMKNPPEAEIESLPYPGITGASPDEYPAYTEWADDPDALTGLSNPNEVGVANLHAPGISGASPDEYPAYTEWADDPDALAGLSNPNEAGVTDLHAPGITGASPDEYPAYSEWTDNPDALAGLANPNEAGMAALHTPGITGASPDEYGAQESPQNLSDEGPIVTGPVGDPIEAGARELSPPAWSEYRADQETSPSHAVDDMAAAEAERETPNAELSRFDPRENIEVNPADPGIALYDPENDNPDAERGFTEPRAAENALPMDPQFVFDDPQTLAGQSDPSGGGIGDMPPPGMTEYATDQGAKTDETAEALNAPFGMAEGELAGIPPPGTREYEAEDAVEALGGYDYESDFALGEFPSPQIERAPYAGMDEWTPEERAGAIAAEWTVEDDVEVLGAFPNGRESEVDELALTPNIAEFMTQEDWADAAGRYDEPAAEALSGLHQPEMSGAEFQAVSEAPAEPVIEGLANPALTEFRPEDAADAIAALDQPYMDEIGTLPYPETTDYGFDERVEYPGERTASETATPAESAFTEDAGIVKAQEAPEEYQVGTPDIPVLTEWTPEDEADVVRGYADLDEFILEDLARPEITESFAGEEADTPEALNRFAVADEGFTAEFFDPEMAESFSGANRGNDDTPEALDRRTAAGEDLSAEFFDPEIGDLLSVNAADTPEALGRLAAADEGFAAEFFDPEMGADDTPEALSRFAAAEEALSAEFFDLEMAELPYGAADTPEALSRRAAMDEGLTAEFFDPEIAELSYDTADTPEALGRLAATDEGFAAEFFDPEMGGDDAPEALSRRAAMDEGLTAEFFDPEMGDAPFSNAADTHEALEARTAEDEGFAAEFFDPALDSADTPEALSHLASMDEGLTAEFFDPEIAENAADYAKASGGAESVETGSAEALSPQIAAAARDTPDATPYTGAPQDDEFGIGEPKFNQDEYGFDENPEIVSDFAHKDEYEPFGTVLPAYDGVETLAFDDKPDASEIGELAVPDDRYMLPDNADALLPAYAPPESGIGELTVPPDMAYSGLEGVADNAETIPAIDEPGEQGIAGLLGPAATEYPVGDAAEALTPAGAMYDDELYGMPSPAFAGSAPQDNGEALKGDETPANAAGSAGEGQENAETLAGAGEAYEDEWGALPDPLAAEYGEDEPGYFADGTEAIASAVSKAEDGADAEQDAASTAAVGNAYDDTAEAIGKYDNGFEVEVVEALDPAMTERGLWEDPETTAGFGPLDIDDTTLGRPVNDYPLYDGVEVSSWKNEPDELNEGGIDDLPSPAYTTETARGTPPSAAANAESLPGASSEVDTDAMPFSAGIAATDGINDDVETTSWHGDLDDDDIRAIPDPFTDSIAANDAVETENPYDDAAYENLSEVFGPSAADIAANGMADDTGNVDEAETSSWYGGAAEDDINGISDPSIAGIAAIDDVNDEVETSNWYGDLAYDDIRGMPDPSAADYTAYTAFEDTQRDAMDNNAEIERDVFDTMAGTINGYDDMDDSVWLDLPYPEPHSFEEYGGHPETIARAQNAVSGEIAGEDASMPYSNDSEISAGEDLRDTPYNESAASGFDEEAYNDILEITSGFEQFDNGLTVSAEPEADTVETFPPDSPPPDGTVALIDLPQLHERTGDRVEALPPESTPSENVRFQEALPVYDDEIDTSLARIPPGDAEFTLHDFTPDPALRIEDEDTEYDMPFSASDAAEISTLWNPPADMPITLQEIEREYASRYAPVLEGEELFNGGSASYDDAQISGLENPPGNEYVELRDVERIYVLDEDWSALGDEAADIKYADSAYDDSAYNGIDDNAQTSFGERPPEDEYIELYDADTGYARRVSGAETTPFEYPPEGERIELYDVERVYPPRRDDVETTAAEYSPDGEYVELRDVERIYPPKRDDAEATDADYSPDAEYVELRDVERIYPPRRDDAEATAAEYSPESEYVELRDVERVYPPRRDDAEITDADYSPDGEYVELYDVERVYPPRRDDAEATAAEYSPDGEYVELRDVERIYPPRRDDAEITDAEYSTEGEYLELRDVERVYPPRTDSAEAASVQTPENAPFSAAFDDSPYYPAVGDVTDEYPAASEYSYEIGIDEPGYAIKKTTTIIEEEGAPGSVKTLTMTPAELRPPPYSGPRFAEPIPEPERREAPELWTRVIPEPNYLPESAFVQAIPAPEVIPEPEISADALISAIPDRPVIMEIEPVAIPVIVTQVIPEPERAYLCDKLPKIARLEKGKYYLQLGIFNRKDALDKELEGIKKNYPLVIETEGARNEIMKLMVGPMNEGESNAVLLRVKREGFKNAFIRHDG